MNHKSANNGSRKSTDSIVIRLKVVKPTDIGFTPRRGKRFSLARNIQIEYGAHSAYYSMGARIKASGA